MRDHGSGLSAGRIAGSFLGILAVSGLVLAFLTMRTVDAGRVGVFQYKPFFFGQGGIDKTCFMGPNRAYMWPSTSMWDIPSAPMTFEVHAEDFMSSDRIPLDFDTAVTLKVKNPCQAYALVEKFGAGPEAVFKTLVLQTTQQGKGTVSSGELMSFLRDQVRHYHSAEFIAAQKADGGPSDAASVVEKKTREHVNKFLAEAGADMLIVENIALGRANPPAGVRTAIEATAAQAQDAKTQVERQKAQTARKEAEIAAANADNAYRNELKLTNEEWLRMKELETYAKVCGNGNCTFVLGNQAGVMVSRK